MATVRFRSTDGNDVDDGSTWPLAKASVDAYTATAGDVLLLSQAHAELRSEAVVIALAGTLATPSYLFGVDDGADPATTLASPIPSIKSNGSFSLSVTGNGYIDSVYLAAGVGASTGQTITLGANDIRQEYRRCSFEEATTSASGFITIGSSSTSTETSIYWRDCNVKFNAAAQRINVTQTYFEWIGGTVLSGGTSPTELLNANGDAATIKVSSLDLSNAAAGLVIFRSGATAGECLIRDSKLPNSWTGNIGVPTTPSAVNKMFNCWSGTTAYRAWLSYYGGSVKATSASTVYFTPVDSSDLGYSMEVVGNTNCEPLVTNVITPELRVYNSATSGTVTATVEIVHDGASALTDKDVFLILEYPTATGTASADDGTATPMASGTAQSTSTAAWTGDTGTGPNGSSTWNTLKLQVSFTATAAGMCIGRVVLGKASTTIYVDPRLRLS